MTPVAYICDDEFYYLEQIQSVFEEQHVENCMYFQDPLDLLRAIGKDTNIFVLDYRMSGFNGITITRRIRSINKHALIIMLSMQDNVSITAEFYDSGGWKYIDKGKQKSSLVEAATWVKTAQRYITDYNATLEWILKNK